MNISADSVTRLLFQMFSQLLLLFVGGRLSHHLCKPQRHCFVPLVPTSLPPPKGPHEETSDRWWAAIRRRHCTAAESLRWCSTVPDRIHSTYARHPLLCPFLTIMLAKSRTATTSLHQSSYVDSLTLRALIRTASGKGGGRNTETEATKRAWHEGLQKRRL